jgi:hypothetical protein
MQMPLRQDLRAQSELLAYLVISQLVSKHATGDWMSVAHTVESVQMWLQSCKRDEDLTRRVMVATRACEIAQRIESEHQLLLNGSAVASTFDKNLRLNFSSALASDIYQLCLNLLLGTRWYVYAIAVLSRVPR